MMIRIELSDPAAFAIAVVSVVLVICLMLWLDHKERMQEIKNERDES